jgi:AraC family transcriptional regulator
MSTQHAKRTAVKTDGIEKYVAAGLLFSSADRRWSGLTAELRHHDRGLLARSGGSADTEICIDLCGNGSVVTRHSRDFLDRTVCERGTIWLSPAGRLPALIDLSDPMPGVLHLYLPPDQFFALGPGIDVAPSLQHQGGFKDPLITAIGDAVESELRTETAAGSILVDTLAAALAARLLQQYQRSRPAPVLQGVVPSGLDRRRLSRILDYIEANLEGDLTLEQMASVACLSRFHFARAFKAAVGRSPHRYVSFRRLERAKALLLNEDQSLVDIALALGFSCQANFTRAFRQATGEAPGHFRRHVSRRQ